MFTFDKPFIAHTKGSNAVIGNYLDGICLISPKWYSITRELEICNYWCGISKGEPRKYANASEGCPGGTQACQAAAIQSPGRGTGLCFQNAAGQLWVGVWRTAGDPEDTSGS
jgi:hypothetical protein